MAALIVNLPLDVSKSGLPQAIKLAFWVIFSLTFMAEASPQLEGAKPNFWIIPFSLFVVYFVYIFNYVYSIYFI